jgi:acyl-CoA synthetase (AMP-forming)/AMP-acid ligase II
MTWKRLYGMGDDTVYLSPAPLYHAAPNRYVQRTIDGGGTAVVLRKFDAARCLELIERTGSRTASGCPPCSCACWPCRRRCGRA